MSKHKKPYDRTVHRMREIERDHQGHWKNSWRPASWVPAEEQHSGTESKVEILKEWLIGQTARFTKRAV